MWVTLIFILAKWQCKYISLITEVSSDMVLKLSRILLKYSLLLISCNVLAQGSWEMLETPIDQHLRSVYFTDSLYGWAVGDTGTIIHTSDGGDSWTIQDAGTNNTIVHVFFLNRQQGWAISWNIEGFFGTLVLKTTDGGITWVHQEFPVENYIANCILFIDSLNGWIGGGNPHPIMFTNDGGQSWEQASIDSSPLSLFPVLNIYFYNHQYGYACGGMFDIAGVTWSTSDGGENWHPIDNSQAPADEVHGIHMYDSLNVIGAGGDPDLGYGVGMLRTTDGGWNWEYEELSMAGNAFDIDFKNEMEAWAPLGPAQELIYSMDAGLTWTVVPTPLSTSIFDMIFTDSLHGYGVGYNGVVIRYIPKPVKIKEEQFKDDGLIALYPNPADKTLWLRFTNRAAAIFTQADFTIADLGGRTMLRSQLKDIAGAQVSYQFDISRFPSGMYTCNIRLLNATTEFSLTKKIVLR
jgi:photosystem II stability/assembly factor-like uncharacterized protein